MVTVCICYNQCLRSTASVISSALMVKYHSTVAACETTLLTSIIASKNMSQKPVASQLSLGAPPKHVVQVKVTDQVLLCEYTHHAGIEGTGTGFGGGVGEGYFRLHENNTVTCTFPEDGTSTLACMAMIKVYNETDVQGNITYSTSISAQGCWIKSSNDQSQCQQDNCLAKRWHKYDVPRDSFCCCTTDLCNKKENIQVVEEPVEVKEHKKSDAHKDSNVVFIISGIMSMLVFCLLVLSAYIFYAKRKSVKQRDLQMKANQYNEEMRMLSDKTPDVSYDDLALGVCLHRGRFGDVYKGKLNDSEVCVKYFHPQQKSLFLTEKEIYSVLSPDVKTIVQCLACDECPQPDGATKYIVIMEYVSLGSLNSYLKSHVINWKEMCSMAKTAAAGIGYLHCETFINGVHKHAIVHRDINSRNILVRPDMTCVIADMGFSMKIRGSKVIRNGVEEHAEDGSLRDVGTVRYMAPEILDCAVNLRDCESSLKQIDIYAFSLVIWELLTRCTDLLYEPKRYMLPFEEGLGSHPNFETMRLHVAKEHNRPAFPVNMKRTDATQLLRETVEECWDTDAEARLSALCVEERFKDIDAMMEHKAGPEMSKNDTTDCEKRNRLSSSSTELNVSEYPELSPLMEGDTSSSETRDAATTNLDTADHNKPDVNIDMDRERLLSPARGRNILVERNTLAEVGDGALAVHDNTLIPVQEAKVRQAAEEERVKRQIWDEQQLSQPSQEGGCGPRPLPRNVQLDVHNEVRNESPKPKENNLNVRRINSQRTIYESSTSSNGGMGNMLTIPDATARPMRPKSLNVNLNIKPELS
ncbi:wit [Bugula neritina]|uniref:receptor protein serine/threonine kinase n=1 Tax=Bugula neritina TaxID=10212 RepID=A0A7J7K4I5_BUGNE|nr:wit [Bugula neritina]